MQLQVGLGLTVINVDGTSSLPWPTPAIHDGGRTLRRIDVLPDDSTRSEVADIIAALDALSL